MTHDMFRHAPEQQAIKSAATVRRDHDKIDIGFFCFAADFVNRTTGSDFDGAFHVAQEIEFAECFHVEPRILEIEPIRARKTRAGPIHHHRRRWLKHVKQT